MSFLKKLIFADAESQSENSQKTPIKQSEVVFSNQGQSPSFSFSNSENTNQSSFPTSVDQNLLAKAIDVYENGFDSLNQNGFDFYEFFKSVSNGGITNPQVYTMAFTMGSAMDSTVTKENLISQADFYVAEINKVYNENVTKGNEKKNSLINQKQSENSSLTDELKMFKEQLEALQIQISNRETKLKTIDGKYATEILEIENKLNANTIAKDKIVQAIETVKSGINTNIK